MLDPIVAVAFSIYSNKGAYALLLGSGVSRTAKIPTGWEIILDLVRKLAAASGETTVANPIEWYRSTFNEEPSYSQLLDRLGSTPEERNNILRGYFEPTDEERENGAKKPTAAHFAIADLVSLGYVRVIVTTNFDRLLETALESAGITPSVLSTPDAIEGALPLQFQNCVIVKVNGDYRDLRTKNTVDELTTYDSRIDALLDRIFDEYGVLICGWSGEWDTALRNAITRARSHRFTPYWMHRGALTEQAQQLARQRRASLVEITDADKFFMDIDSKVRALQEFEHPHPLSEQMALATVKRLISNPTHVIALHDLVAEEVEHVYHILSGPTMPVTASDVSFESIAKRMERMRAAGSVLLRIVPIGCFWGKPDHVAFWSAAIERLSNFPLTGGRTVLIELRRYLGMLLLYAGSLGCIAGQRYDTIRNLWLSTRIRLERGGDGPVIMKQYALSILDGDVAGKVLFENERLYTPMSDHVHAVLREPLRELIRRDEQYDECFDVVEYLISLKYFDEAQNLPLRKGWAPLGRFGWHDSDRRVFSRLLAEASSEGQAYWPINSKLFSSLDHFVEVHKLYAEQILPYANRMLW